MLQITPYYKERDNSTFGNLTYTQFTNVHHARYLLPNIFMACADG